MEGEYVRLGVSRRGPETLSESPPSTRGTHWSCDPDLTAQPQRRKLPRSLLSAPLATLLPVLPPPMSPPSWQSSALWLLCFLLSEVALIQRVG